MKNLFLIVLMFFGLNSVFSQEKQKWNFGISCGIGGANATFLPAFDIDYRKNTFNLGVSRNTWTLGYTRDLLYFGKNKNFAWVSTLAFVADFLPNPNFATEQIWIPDYFTRPKDTKGRFVYLAYSGVRVQFLKRCYASYQLGLGFADPYSPNSNPKSYFGIVGQIGIAIRLLKIRED